MRELPVYDYKHIKEPYSRVDFIFRRFPDFLTGWIALKAACHPARLAIEDATNKCIGLGTLCDFVSQAWPGQSEDKISSCLLTMQALITPKSFPNVYCQTSPDGLAYRTNNGTIFGWRRYKDGAYLFTARPKGPYKEQVAATLLAFGWNQGKKFVVPDHIRTLATKDMLVKKVPAQPQPAETPTTATEA